MSYILTTESSRPSKGVFFFEYNLKKQPPSDVSAAVELLKEGFKEAGGVSTEVISENGLIVTTTNVWPDKAAYETYKTKYASEIAVRDAARVAYNTHNSIARSQSTLDTEALAAAAVAATVAGVTAPVVATSATVSTDTTTKV